VQGQASKLRLPGYAKGATIIIMDWLDPSTQPPRLVLVSPAAGRQFRALTGLAWTQNANETCKAPASSIESIPYAARMRINCLGVVLTILWCEIDVGSAAMQTLFTPSDRR